MLDSSEDDAVLRMWALSEAPREIRQALDTTDPDSWVAHVPRELMDEPLVALLSMKSSPSRPLTTILLPDGSTLLSGALSISRWQGGDSTQHTAIGELRPRASGEARSGYAARLSPI